MQKFEKGFFIGAATAAHQVEGNNTNSDYWAQEQLPHSSFTEPSGIACDHYHRYEEDIKLLADAGLNAYRFSIEWARVEPEEGTFNPEAIEHYRKVIACCKAHGVEPVVTLLHFTSPSGSSARAAGKQSPPWRTLSTMQPMLWSSWAASCAMSAPSTKRIWLAAGRYFQAVPPDGRTGCQECRRSRKVCRGHGAGGHELPEDDGKHEVCCHGECTGVRHTPAADLCQRAHLGGRPAGVACPCSRTGCHQSHLPQVKVGLTLSLHDLQAQPGGEAFAEAAWQEEFTHYLPYIKEDDFLGVQNYTRTLYGPQGQLPAPEGAELTQMEYEFYPQALEHVIRKVAEEFKGDLIVTENGIATADDARRVAFIRQALDGVQHCIATASR